MNTSRPSLLTGTRAVVAVGALVAGSTLAATAGTASADGGPRHPRSTVYTQTNDPAGNAVLAFTDSGAGSLVPLGSVATGGLGTGTALGSQGSVTLSDDGRFLFAVNAGSDSVSAFRLSDDGVPSLLGSVPSRGSRPISVTARRGAGFVLNDLGLSVSGFRYGAAGITTGGTTVQPLGAAAAGPAQVRLAPDGRHLVVTEKVSSTLDVLPVTGAGRTGPARTSAATGATPFGFDFTTSGTAVVSEAGSATAETFRVRPDASAVPQDLESNGGQGAPCWLVVSRAGYAFTANAAGTANSISSFRVGGDGDLTLLATRAAATDLHPTDMALGDRERSLYNLSDRTGQIDVSAVDGSVLTGTHAAVGGLPLTISGLAATS